MRHNGQRSANPFVRLSSTTLHRLSLHLDGGDPPAPPAISDEVRQQIGAAAVEAYKSGLPKPPEKYEVKIPEGSMIPATSLEKVTIAARELGLASNESAQRLIDLLHGETKAAAERIASDYSPGGAVFEDQRRKWQDVALQAADIGNGSSETLQAKVALVTTFTNKYFPDDVRKLLNDTGIGSHPNFFRAMFKLAEAMKEDGFVTGSTFRPRKSAADRIYGDPPTGGTR